MRACVIGYGPTGEVFLGGPASGPWDCRGAWPAPRACAWPAIDRGRTERRRYLRHPCLRRGRWHGSGARRRRDRASHRTEQAGEARLPADWPLASVLAGAQAVCLGSARRLLARPPEARAGLLVRRPPMRRPGTPRARAGGAWAAAEYGAGGGPVGRRYRRPMV